MRAFPVLALLAGSFLTPTAALAQEGSLDQLRQRIAALEAELARLSAEVEALEIAAEVPPPSPASMPAPATPAPAQPSIAWKGAPELTAPGGWTFKPRGRLNVDAGFVAAPDSVVAADGFGSEIRRARLGVEGSIPGGFGYKFEVDLAGDEVELTDALLTYSDGPIRLNVGQHNSFQSLEELSSSRFTSFIERAAFTDAFGFERRLGVSAEFSGGTVLAQAGLFSDNVGDLPGQNWSIDGRLVLMPRLGDAQLHLGGSAHYAELEDTPAVRYRQRPLVHFTSTRFIDTGTLAAQSELGLGLEAALIRGPLHLAGEAFHQSVDRPMGLTGADFRGAYAEAGLFLTPGDRRGYGKGVFDRVRPAGPLDEGGIGAVQVNLRYDYLDLTDAGVTGGVQNGYMASLVWTPTDYTRLMLNYAHLAYDRAVLPATGGAKDYAVDSVGMRAQVDF